MVSGIHDFDALLTVYGVCDPFDFVCYEAVKCLYEFVDFFLHGRKCRFVVPGSFLSRGTRSVVEDSVMSQGCKAMAVWTMRHANVAIYIVWQCGKRRIFAK